MSTHTKKRHRSAMPSIKKILALTSTGDLIWRMNSVADHAIPTALRSEADRTRFFSDWVGGPVDPVGGLWFDTRLDGKRLVLIEGIPSVPTLPVIVGLYSLSHDGSARILAFDTDGEDADASPVWVLMKAVLAQWRSTLPADIETLLETETQDDTTQTETTPEPETDDFYADPDGITLQRLFQIIGRDRLCELYADFWANQVVDNDGLSDKTYDDLYAEYDHEAMGLAATILDAAPIPSTTRLVVTRPSTRSRPDQWRLGLRWDGGIIQMASIITTLHTTDQVCPTYWSTSHPATVAERNRIRQKALENASLIAMCWLARLKTPN